MELPDDIYELVQNHLGHEALTIQARYGRGAWIATDGQAGYVPLAQLPNLFGGGSRIDFNQVINEVKTSDPAKQVVIIFNIQADLQMISVVDIE